VVAELRSRQQELEWSVEEARTKAGNIEAKLYGGTVRNPKELEDLQADLKSLKTQLRTREDALLALLVDLEEADTELAAMESVYADVASRWTESQTALLGEKTEVGPEIARLSEERASQVAGVDKGALGLYNLLRERRAGRAVALVERGMCAGCRITLPMSVLQKARSGVGLVQCVSCERILLV
jgi:predicted  nucleic acid-binding Zn-ribbon protein